ncbi:hypothetical protein ACLQ28_10940 [Micromonospora sp. DT201]|uniref:hypothetical protein n=1 Tax=Micromonospora sp. DT201 TaxID=3393442 RepID=UPI003CEECBEA
MPPRQHPRSWLAGRLRSAAGAVQRLAGRVEPAGQLPPSEEPTAAPRRFGEPPQHWLDLVSAHAPGLLHDLDFDMSPVGSEDASARDDRPGETASIGRLGGDGAAPAPAGALASRPSASGGAAAVRRGGPGTSGFATPDGSRPPGGTGRSGRTPAAGDGPPSTAGSFGGGGARASGPDTPAGPSGLDAPERPAGSVRPGAWGDTAGVGGNGPPRAGQPDQPVHPLIRPAIPGPLASPGDHHEHRTDDLEPTPRAPRSPLDPRRPPATTGDVLADRLSAAHDGLRSDQDGSADDQTRRRASHPRFAGGHPRFADGQPRFADGQPGFADGQPGFADGQPGFADGQGDAVGTRPSGPGNAAARRAPAWPDLDAVDRVTTWTGSAGATVAGDAEGTTNDRRRDLDHTAGDWPWLTLPDEPARPRQQQWRSAGQRVDEMDAVGGGAWAGAWGPGPAAGRRSASTGPWSSAIEARVTDPWPALPDDATLWTVPGDALNDAELARLDREQAGD